MPIINGVYTALTLSEALANVVENAPASIVFAPGNPPELVLANMFAQANVQIDTSIGETLAALMSPVGAMIDLQNPNNPRKGAIATVGTIKMVNSSGDAIVVTPGSIFTASTGQQYKTGETSITVANGATEYVAVTAIDAGAAGNIPAGLSFSSAFTLTVTNPVMWTNGADAETDARYLQRVTITKTEYGSQVTSVATETDLKKIYTAARMYTNRNAVALSTPVPVPGNGYNCVVLTPNGIYENAAVMSQIFDVLSRRLEFVNSQNVSDARHVVKSGTVYVSGVPQSYYYTVAQNVLATLTATIYVRFVAGTDPSERITQAVDFATYFIRRLVAYLSGIAGTTNITFINDEYESIVTAVDIAADPGSSDPIAPTFGISAIRDLVSDAVTRSSTPQLMYDSTNSLSLTLDPDVPGESPITMTLVSARQFIDFRADALFSDSTSWFDRTMILDPSQIAVTVVDIS